MRKAIMVGLLAIAALLSVGKAQANPTISVRVTYYLPTGSMMRTEIWPFWGAAACDPNYLPLGTVFVLNGETFTCLDTGGAVKGWHVDIFTWTWDSATFLQSIWGAQAEITVVEWGE
jgi:3D (Asp-Asp-Asp) domain-containing protein